MAGGVLLVLSALLRPFVSHWPGSSEPKKKPAVTETRQSALPPTTAPARQEIREKELKPKHVQSLQNSDVFLSPQHDLRIVMKMDDLKSDLARYHTVYYGNHFRLDELGCGDPPLSFRINRKPMLTLSGWLRKNGAYGTRIALNTHVYAKVYGTCIRENPSVRVPVRLMADVSEIETAKDIKLTGQMYIGTLIRFLDRSFPLSGDLHQPVQSLNGLVVQLKPVQGVNFDFGKLENGAWISNGTKKIVPLMLNAGSFGGESSDNRYFIVDASVGGEKQLLPFTTKAEQVADFEWDLPIFDDATIGISIGPGLFGKVESGRPGTGVFNHLLPVRITGETDHKAGRAKYEIILDGAETTFVAYKGTPAIKVKLTATRARVWKIKGGRIIGTGKVIKEVHGDVVFAEVKVEDGRLSFKVADLDIDLTPFFELIPIKLSIGELEEALNGGKIDLANVKTEHRFELPRCPNLGYEKFQPAGDHPSCGYRSRHELPGYLSLMGNDRHNGKVGTKVKLDLDSLTVRRWGERLQMGMRMTVEDIRLE